LKKKVLLKDIAQELGVSTALVSYVLNNKEKESRVGKEIAERIRKTAEELNYQPNQIAKSLKSGKTNTLGLIVADISNPFFAQIARIIEDEANKNGFTVIFGSSDEKAEKSWDLINALLNKQVDGLIIAPSEYSEEQVLYLEKHAIPFVLIDRYFPEIKSNYVAIDNYEAAYNAITHLIRKGYKQIGMIAYETQLFHMQERKRGYLDALHDGGVVSSELWLKEARHSMVKEDLELFIPEMLITENKVDAIFFATNTLAIRGLKIIDSLNVKIPKDIGIVSFDEGEAFDFYYCPLTYVRQPVEDIGKNAVQILLASIKKDEKISHVLLNTQLVIRKSSGS